MVNIDLHEVACILFPWIKEEEDDKIKLKLLKEYAWEHDKIKQSYCKNGYHIDKYTIFKLDLDGFRDYLKTVERKLQVNHAK